MIRAVIVDDEEPARALLRRDLAAHAGIEVVAECGNGFEAIKAVAELTPDLLLLDIQMPKLNGFEVLELIERPIAVVFITAYEEHALRAFEVHAVDYLLKPFTPERLAQAIERATRRLSEGKSVSPAALSAAARSPGRKLDRILVREGDGVHVIPVENIDYIEAQDDYVSIRSSGKSHLKQQRLTDLESLLDAGRFVRIHRSYLLNVERLTKLELYAKDSRVAILADGTRLPVSRPGYARLRTML